MKADDARSESGFEGGDVKVGVLSDSYNQSGASRTAQDDIDSGDLPPSGRIDILDDTEPGDDEGRAMMQIIHDIAPGADLAFHTASGGQANFAQGIRDLENAGSSVITDDIYYFAEPMFQDGVIAEAVEDVSKDGVAYFSAAGNRARQSHTQSFSSSGSSGPNGGTLHDFGGGDTRQQVSIPTGEEIWFSFQWVDPYASVSSSGVGADTDLNIYLVDQADSIVARSEIDNIGGDPIEVITFENDGSIDADGDGSADTQFDLQIELSEGPAPDRMTYIYGGGDLSIDEYQNPGPSTFGHYNAEGSHSVAAAAYFNTPEFGTDPPQVNSFSSEGGVPIYFDDDGNRLSSQEVRQVPDVTGPDGGNNTFFGSDSDADSDNYPNFFGTSAAAPHVAGAAALMLSKNPGLQPSEIYSKLEDTAIDMDDPATSGFDDGYDRRTGYGLIQADQALSQVTEETPPTAPTGLTASAGDQEVSLSWDANSENDLAGYNLYRSTSSFTDPTSATQVNGSLLTSTSYTDSGLSNGTTYYYRLTAVDEAGAESTPSGEASATPSATTRPAVSFVRSELDLDEGPDAVWGDYDGDGDLDLFVCCSTLYRNDGRWNFTKVNAGIRDFPAIIDDQVMGSADWGDFNGDGRLDLVIAGYETGTSGTAEIYRNDGDTDGDGTVEFSKVNAGLNDLSRGGDIPKLSPEAGGLKRTTSQWGDYNNDGRLDLIVTGGPTSVYRNDGDGNFTDIDAGVANVSWGSSQWGDYDGDGDLDLVVSGRNEGVHIYKNEGGGQFVDINADVKDYTFGFTKWADYDNDGDLDLAAGGSEGMGIYENEGSDTFQREKPGFGGYFISDEPRYNGSLSWGDYDNDGDLDIVVTGEVRALSGTFTEGESSDISAIYENKGNGEFSYVASVYEYGYGYSSVEWGDYDGDGDQDLLMAGGRTIVVQNGFPEEVRARASRTFNGAATSNDYRLVGLPGAADQPIDRAVDGDFGSAWKAYWDDGSSDDYLIEFDDSDTFDFRKGRGFWLTATQPWTTSESYEALRPNGDRTVSIPLHDGWNIISNPLGASQSWVGIEDATGTELQPIFYFYGSYGRADTMWSASTGQAYYFYNDQNLDSLQIPYPEVPINANKSKFGRRLGVGGMQKKGSPSAEIPSSAETRSDREDALLSLSARSVRTERTSSTVRIGFCDSPKHGDGPKDVIAPPGQFEDTSLRIRASGQPDSSRTRHLMTDWRSGREEEEKSGETFDLVLSTSTDSPVRLEAVNEKAVGNRNVTLLHPASGASYNLQADDKIRIDPQQKQTRLRLAVGSARYVNQKEEEILPSEISLDVYPNPIKETGTVEYTLPEPKNVRLVVYDVLGRQVAVLEKGQQETGRHRVRVGNANLSSGVYFGRLTAGGQTRTQKITVVR
ncbi:hypothetical protein BSZ35_18175 [Salinibacter sp. 10B]|uniref:FG-GAP-like repeat-containing protein n=1 Tax=Salinibacter sp. 10B TaxID=1923971 RepID=UPI000D2B3F64|nr:FG-GAP-like repeat-containing protein [Salinibacter sp. 10B]PQJ26858.1 hypothetical protein BSZ35_18175 [Salinibacter sp. 10B]